MSPSGVAVRPAVTILAVALAVLLAAAPTPASGLNEYVSCRDHTEIYHTLGSVELGFSYADLLAVQGDAAYVAGIHDPFVVVIDITDPTAPAVAGQLALPEIPTGLAAGPNVLLATVPGLGLLRFDLADPLIPDAVDTLDLGGNPRDVILVDQIAYVALGGGGVRAVTLAYPGLTIPMGQVDTGGAAETLAWADGLLYVGDTTEGLVVVDTSDPTRLVAAGSASFGAIPRHVDVGHGRVAVAGRPFNNENWRVTVYDLTDPHTPTAVATRVRDDAYFMYPRVAMAGPDRVLVAAMGDAFFDFRVDGGTLKIFGSELISATRPIWQQDRSFLLTYRTLQLGTSGYLPPGQYTALPSGRRHTLNDGDIVYAASWYGLRVADLSDPLQPIVTDILPLPGNLIDPAQALTQSTLYVGDPAGAFTIVDVTEPLAPVVMSTFTLSGVPRGLHADGDRLYAAVGRDGLTVLDVTAPLAPVVLGEIPTVTDALRAAHMVKVGDDLLVAADGGGIDVFDVADPAAPALVDHLPMAIVSDLAVVGDRVLAGWLDGALATWRREPSGNWQLIGTGPVTSTRSLAVVGDLAYVADAWYRLDILDVSGDLPSILYTGEVNSGSNDVVLAGDDWIAMGQAGLVVYPAQCAAAPTAAPPPVPAATRFGAPYPNPFNPSTTLNFSLAASGPARLVVYDMTGRRVRTLWDGPAPAGTVRVGWDGRDAAGRRAPSGVYLARLVAGGRTETRKLALIE